MGLAWRACVALLLCSVLAYDETASHKDYDRQKCSGVYSKHGWSGPHEPYIQVNITPHSQPQGWVAVLIFNYADIDSLGAKMRHDNKKYVCDEAAVAAGMCEQAHMGTFITSNASVHAPVLTQRVNLNDIAPITYRPIDHTGYYCVSTYPQTASTRYTARIRFQNPYGQLSASAAPKMTFYGAMAIAYLTVSLLWLFLYKQYRHEILPVQNYITAITLFLVVEMVVIWGYYNFVNLHSHDTPGARVFLGCVSLLSAFRNAFTFFLLLIVCLGYGVVRPSLGPLMWRCRALAGVHFLFSAAFSVLSYVLSPDQADSFVLFIVLPLAVTTTVFYAWILTALSATTKDLVDRKQYIKAQMYRRLWGVLLGSMIVIFLFFMANSLALAQLSALDYITSNWRTRWFLLDGWLNVVYFVDFVIVSYLWRPTQNNSRFAMSSQIAQDENDVNEFDLESLEGNDDDDPKSPRVSEHSLRSLSGPSRA